jgi:transcription antitermination factor NusG
MDIGDDLNWFAIQTKTHQERLAAAHLERFDVEVFFPRIRQEQKVCGVYRTVCRALFAGYCFARFRPLVSLGAVRYAPGVLRVVGNEAGPLPLDPGIIAAIRAEQQADGTIRLQSRRLLAGEKVTIDRGPFAGWMGRVEREWDDGKRVLILLEAIQAARCVVEKRCLAVVDQHG